MIGVDVGVVGARLVMLRRSGFHGCWPTRHVGLLNLVGVQGPDTK